MLPNASTTGAAITGPPQKEPARFGAGTGLAGAGDRRPTMGRQDTAPSSLSPQPPQPLTVTRHPQASRPAPRPPLPASTASVAPATPGPNRNPTKISDRQQDPLTGRDDAPTGQEARERPNLPPSKTAPATSAPETDPVNGPAGAVVGPPPVKPIQALPKSSEPSPGVAAASAALEGKTKGPPPETERRISTLSEPQIMEKLRQVVSQDDPKAIYATIRKIGQG